MAASGLRGACPSQPCQVRRNLAGTCSAWLLFGLPRPPVTVTILSSSAP